MSGAVGTRYRFCGDNYTIALVRWLSDEEAVKRFQEPGFERHAGSVIKQLQSIQLYRETFDCHGFTVDTVKLDEKKLDGIDDFKN